MNRNSGSCHLKGKLFQLPPNLTQLVVNRCENICVWFKMNEFLEKRRTVAIIGAGPAGLVVAQKFLKREELFEVTIFEKLHHFGGTWIYTEDVSDDKYGLPVHSSLYHNLRTNLPTALMEFDDFPHNLNPSGFVTHQQVLQYLQRFAHHFDLHKYTKFLHLVTLVSRDLNGWIINLRNLETGQNHVQKFDIVCICQGRFGLPSIPSPQELPGLDDFKGQILHTHVYRRPEVFRGQRVAVLGGGPSGVDISLEVAECAKETFLCYQPKKDGKLFPFGEKIIQPGAIFKSIGPDFIELTNGEMLSSIDTIIFATGYNIYADLIHPSCGIKVIGSRVDGLFLHMINILHPTMAFFGLLEKIPPFNVFCQMAEYYVRTLIGQAKLPSQTEMLIDLAKDRSERESLGSKLKHAHRMFEDQLWRYDQQISDLGGFAPLPPVIKSLYDECFALRWQSNDYKDYQFLFNSDGTYTTIYKDQAHHGDCRFN